MPQPPLRLLIGGTDTDVGKTHITCSLVRGLRAAGRKVWLHKPAACGDWQDNMAEDTRSLLPMAGDGQDPATICPRQWPAVRSPHIAAALAGDSLSKAEILDSINTLACTDADLIVEGAGGVLAPLGTDLTNLIDLADALGWPVLIVTRPHLGTLNHTSLTTTVLQTRGIQIAGLVINHHDDGIDPGLASDAREELPKLTGCQILAEFPYGVSEDCSLRLAEQLLASP